MSKDDKNLDKNISYDANSKEEDVGKLLKLIKTKGSKPMVLKPRKSKLAKVSMISSAVVAAAGVGVGAAIYISNQNEKYVITVFYEGNVLKEPMLANKVKDLKIPEIPGYSFAGWYKDPSYVVKYNSNFKFEEDTTVYGKYVPKEYKVKFLNHGAIYKDQTVSFDSNFIFPTMMMEKTGYEFKGWALDPNTAPDSSLVHAESSELTMDVVGGMTFHAIWEAKKYDFTIYDSEGEIIEVKQLYYEANIQEFLDWGLIYEDYSRYLYGYEIDGQVYRNGIIYMPAYNVSARPKWEYSQVNVKLNLNGAGEQSSFFTDEYNLSYDPMDNDSAFLTMPAHDEYLFLGWSTSSTGAVSVYDSFTLDKNVHKNNEIVNLYAIWGYKYQIIDESGAVIASGDAPSHNLIINLEDLVSSQSKLNHVFEGFKVLEQDGNPIGVATKQYFEITDDTPKSDGVVILKSQFVPNREILTFNINNEEIERLDRLNDTQNKVCDTNGVEIISLSSMTLVYGINETAELPILKTLDGSGDQNYNFLGWSTTQGSTTAEFVINGGKIIYSLPAVSQEANKEIALYAVWEGQVIDIGINITNSEYGTVIGGNAGVSVSAPYGSSIEVYSPGAADPGFLIGDTNQIRIVARAKDDTYLYDYYINSVTRTDGTVVTKQTKLNISFGRNYRLYDITLNLNGGSIIDQAATFKSRYENVSCDPESSVIINTPRRDNYTFLGWSKDREALVPEYVYNGSDVEFTMPQENWGKTLYAIWEGVEQEVTIDQTLQDGKTYEGEQIVDIVKYGEIYHLPRLTCTDPNYYHAGYSYGEETYGVGYPLLVEGDITLTPIWSDKIVVNYYVNNDDATGCENGSVMLAPDEVNKSVNELLGSGFELSDSSNVFVFLGWSLTPVDCVIDIAEATTLLDNEEIIDFSMTNAIYAVWQIRSYEQEIEITQTKYTLDKSQSLQEQNIATFYYNGIEIIDGLVDGEKLSLHYGVKIVENLPDGGVKLSNGDIITYTLLETDGDRATTNIEFTINNMTEGSISGENQLKMVVSKVYNDAEINYEYTLLSNSLNIKHLTNYATISPAETVSWLEGVDQGELPILRDNDGNYTFKGWAVRPAGDGIPATIYNYGDIIFDEGYTGTVYAIWEGRELSIEVVAGEGMEDIICSYGTYTLRFGDVVEKKIDDYGLYSLNIIPQMNMNNVQMIFNRNNCTSERNMLWNWNFSTEWLMNWDGVQQNETIAIDCNWYAIPVKVQFRDWYETEDYNLGGLNSLQLEVPAFEGIKHTHISMWDNLLTPGNIFNPYVLTNAELLNVYGMTSEIDGYRIVFNSDREWNQYKILVPESPYFTITNPDVVSQPFTYAPGGRFRGFAYEFTPGEDVSQDRCIKQYTIFISGLDSSVEVVGNDFSFVYACLPDNMQDGDEISFSALIYDWYHYIIDYGNVSEEDREEYGDIYNWGDDLRIENWEFWNIHGAVGNQQSHATRENYHLLGFSTDKNATMPDEGLDYDSLHRGDGVLSIHFSVGTTVLYPVWEGNSRWLVFSAEGTTIEDKINNGAWAYIGNGTSDSWKYVERSSIGSGSPNFERSWRQGDTITLPTEDEIRDSLVGNGIDPWNMVFAGFTYTDRLGEVYNCELGGQITINEDDNYNPFNGTFDWDIEDISQINLKLNWEYKKSNVEFVVDGGIKNGSFEDCQIKWGERLEGFVCTPNEYRKYFAGWKVDLVSSTTKTLYDCVDANGFIIGYDESGDALDPNIEYTYRLTAVYKNTIFNLKFCSEDENTTYKTEQIEEFEGRYDLTLNYNEGNFEQVPTDHKISHFRLVRADGSCETSIPCGKFNYITRDIETYDRVHDIYIYVYFEPSTNNTQLLRFHAVTVPDKLDCILSDRSFEQVDLDEITTYNKESYKEIVIPTSKDKVKVGESGELMYFVGWSTDDDSDDVEVYPGEIREGEDGDEDFYPVYKPATDVSYFNFNTLDGGETYFISGVKQEYRNTECLVLPSTYDGSPVTAIGDPRFSITLSVFSRLGVKRVVIPDSITKIDYCAFEGCAALTSIELPRSLKTEYDETTETYFYGLGSLAFKDCRNLRLVEFADGIQLDSLNFEVFSGCWKLTSIEIPKGITAIGASTFWDSGLRKVSFEEGNALETIGQYAFYLLRYLEEIDLPNTVNNIGAEAFYHNINLESFKIPENTKTIGYRAFMDCGNLRSITIPESVESIGEGVFSRCDSLEYVINKSSHITIDMLKNAGVKCSIYQDNGDGLVLMEVVGKSITELAILEGTTKIADYAFQECTLLQSVTIPDSVTEIGESAFSTCFLLDNVVLPEGLKTIGSYAFSGCSCMTEITIPSTVTEIGMGAFMNCFDLNHIDLSNTGVTVINKKTFANCTSLESVELPDSLVTIGEEAFYQCTALEEITIPKNVANVENNAFYGAGLTKVIVLYDGVTLFLFDLERDAIGLSGNCDIVYVNDGE